MKEVIRQIPLYRFFNIVMKLVWTNRLKESEKFAQNNGYSLNIENGDMRNLRFDDSTFSFVYSYNSIFHMSKEDIQKSINEFYRVLKPKGLMFVNFLTTSDFRCGHGENLGQNQYNQIEDCMSVIHSYFEENEADRYFEYNNMEIIYKEIRGFERIYEGKKIRQGYVDYIIRK